VVSRASELPYDGNDLSSGEPKRQKLFRSSVLQVVVAPKFPQQSAFFPRCFCLYLTFLLPSRGYATMVLRQLSL